MVKLTLTLHQIRKMRTLAAVCRSRISRLSCLILWCPRTLALHTRGVARGARGWGLPPLTLALNKQFWDLSGQHSSAEPANGGAGGRRGAPASRPAALPGRPAHRAPSGTPRGSCPLGLELPGHRGCAGSAGPGRATPRARRGGQGQAPPARAPAARGLERRGGGAAAGGP